MAACNFTIPIPGDATETFNKAKAAIEKQGGNFTGTEQGGEFDVTVMGYTIAGSFISKGKDLAVTISSKPIFISCDMVESFLKGKLA